MRGSDFCFSLACTGEEWPCFRLAHPGPLCHRPHVPLALWGEHPEADSPWDEAEAPSLPSPEPQTGAYAPRCLRGFVSSTQGSSCISRDWEEVGAPYLCHPTSGAVWGWEGERLQAASIPRQPFILCPRATATLSPSLFTDGADTAEAGGVAGPLNRPVTGRTVSDTLRGCCDCAELQCLLFLTPNN